MKKKYKKNLTRFLLILLLILFSFFIVIYLISKPINSKLADNQKEVNEFISKEDFFLELSPYAKEVSASHGVRPSLLLAQAALESNWGKSDLARESNNYFGIKNKKGKEYTTKEFYANEWSYYQSYFEEYDNAHDSVIAYADLLKFGTSWDENLYQEVIQAESYHEAAYALVKAGYASDPNYAEKIIQIIEQYELNEFD